MHHRAVGESDSVAIEDDGAVIYKTCDREVTGQRPHAARSDRHDGVILCRRGAKDRKIFLLFSKGMTSFWVSGVSIRRRPESRRKTACRRKNFNHKLNDKWKNVWYSAYRN